jgi:hypothetical protein
MSTSTSRDARDDVSIRSHANATQSSLVTYVEAHPSLSIERRFWITNAVVLAIGPDAPPLAAIREIDHVTAIHPNAEYEAVLGASTPTQGDGMDPDPAADRETNTATAMPTATATSTATANTAAATAGVERLRAPTAWERYDTRGDGVRVAVLDTGVAADHPDIRINESNWAEFDRDGTALPSEPYDDNSHGTHVSGSVVGGNASGEWIGTAPNATLLHAKVLDAYGTGTFAQFVAGLQWAIEADADVVTMSFGVTDRSEPFLEPIYNAEREGVPVVAAVGNTGVNTSSSPGNVYEAIAVGAVNETDTVPAFSSGETIETDADWSDPPDRWPASYTVPDVVAPGTDITSSYPGGGYRSRTGTSMSTAYTGGVLSLLQSAFGSSFTPTHYRERIETTADRPPSAEPTNRTRYGAGILNATALLAAPNEPIGAAPSPPHDPDLDGRYEDINANGQLDIGDVQALYTGRRNGDIRNVRGFDFNANGRLDIGDVQTLYNEYRQQN